MIITKIRTSRNQISAKAVYSLQSTVHSLQFADCKLPIAGFRYLTPCKKYQK
ncbi:hypothetical protein KsCSTR_10670 [Candidatus Kuenenia stuttgartiensis]|uniref:Uncharacterized protein n=1 Tax=Kuenenia stuttgartiensis TaxID=174633 RepID=Q1PYN3_KUEST|nr:hypothetical protein KsCSTR_10670 [Candidatus Kuenenia stuttgartiensis]CAJ72194.1 unknown protein [Candidatus Kuenenia stuttgartiensis]